MKTSLAGFDLYTEGLAYWNQHSRRYLGALAGFYREFKLGFDTKVIGEFWYDGREKYTTTDLTNTNVGLGFVADDFGDSSDLRLRLKWTHSLTDRSGQVVTAVDLTPLPKLNIAFAIPVTYGAADSVYVSGNADPEDRLLAAMLTVTVDIDLSESK